MKHKRWGELLHMRSGWQRRQSTGRGRGEEEERAITRDNLVHTLSLVAAAFTCGLVTSQRGPSILDLGRVSGADLQATTSLFALGAGGHLTGCLATGLVLGRFRSGLFLFWSLLALAVATVGLPWCHQYGIMAAVYFLGFTCVGAVETGLPWCHQYGIMAAVYFLGFTCVGVVETGTYSEVAQKWGGQGGKIVQLLQLVFVVGGVVSPALTQFFLMSRHGVHHVHYGPFNRTEGDSTLSVNQSNRSTPAPGTLQEWTTSPDSLFSNTSGNASADAVHGADHTNIQYAYIIAAVVSLVAAVPFIASHLRCRSSLPFHPHQSSVADREQVRDRRVLVLMLVAVFFFSVSAVEESFQQFLLTFLVREEHWSPFAAAWITTWFWCGMLLVRLAAYLLPEQVGDEACLAVSCALLPCSLAGLQASLAFASSDGVWACVFFTGMSASLIFPVSFTWLHGCLAHSSGAVSAIVMLSSALAGVVNPLVLGYLLHSGCGEGLPYLLIGEACAALLTFLILYKMSRNLNATWRSVATIDIKEDVSCDKFEEVKDDHGL